VRWVAGYLDGVYLGFFILRGVLTKRLYGWCVILRAQSRTIRGLKLGDRGHDRALDIAQCGNLSDGLSIVLHQIESAAKNIQKRLRSLRVHDARLRFKKAAPVLLREQLYNSLCDTSVRCATYNCKSQQVHITTGRGGVVCQPSVGGEQVIGMGCIYGSLFGALTRAIEEPGKVLDVGRA